MYCGGYMLPAPAAGNWMLLLPQPDLTLQQDDVTDNTSCSWGIKLQHRLFANAWFFCVSQTFWCRCNWKQHHVNETTGVTSHSLEILHYIVRQSFCCVWLCACKIQYVFTGTHTHKSIHTYDFSLNLVINSQITQQEWIWPQCRYVAINEDCAFVLYSQQPFTHVSVLYGPLVFFFPPTSTSYSLSFSLNLLVRVANLRAC